MAANLKTLIDADYLKDYELVDSNIDDNRIIPVIMTAQRLYIRDLLGSKLYNRLGQGVLNNDLTSEERVLLSEYVAPCLAKYTMYELRANITHQLTNKGSQIKSSDNSQASDDSSLKWLMDKDLITAGAFAKTLEEFLCANRTTFPLYSPKKVLRGGLYTGAALEDGGQYVNGRKVNSGKYNWRFRW